MTDYLSPAGLPNWMSTFIGSPFSKARKVLLL
jgi:hypothetical protein